MKAKILIGLVIITITIFTIQLFIKTSYPTKLISIKKVHSYVHTNLKEEFTIPLLVNKENSPYSTEEFIFSAVITDQEISTIIPLEISEIRQDSYTVLYQGEEYYQFYVDCYINIEANDFYFKIDEAILKIKYNDQLELNFLIGEFNYIYQNLTTPHLSLFNLSADYTSVLGINTLSGLNIELSNKINKTIVIKSIDVYSINVSSNNFYLKVVDDFSLSINEKLYIEEYNHLAMTYPYEQSIYLNTNNALKLFIPLNYHGEVKYINQFGITIQYEINSIVYKMVIDDFLFMSTSPFRMEVEQYYTTYEIEGS